MRRKEKSKPVSPTSESFDIPAARAFNDGGNGITVMTEKAFRFEMIIAKKHFPREKLLPYVASPLCSFFAFS